MMQHLPRRAVFWLCTSPLLTIILFATVRSAAAQLLSAKFTPPTVAQTIPSTSLKEALNELANRYKVVLAYKDKLVEDRTVQNYDWQEQSEVIGAIQTLLAPFNLTFKKVGTNTYVIKTRSSLKQAAESGMTSNNPPSLYADSSQGDIPPTSSDQASQAVMVRGKVSNDQNEGIPGVSITLKGTTTGTSTDTEGRYQLSVPDGHGTLVFSYIGFVSEEIVLANQAVVNVTLLPDIQSLSEVVVLGYGEQKKATMTGAVATVNMEVLQDRGTLTQPMQALQGTVPGVVVTRNSSAPGREGWSFQIRGNTSVNSIEPLVVIDGIPYPNTSVLDAMNPNDIESMSILKDGSAAIYGSRGGGGVVLVTTKKGKKGKIEVAYRGNVNFKSPGRLDATTPASMQQFAEMYLEGARLDGIDTYDNNPMTTSNVVMWKRNVLEMWAKPELRPASGYINTPAGSGTGDDTFFDVDWANTIWGTAVSNQHSVNISAASEKSTVMASFGYLNDQSLLKWGNDNSKRYNTRVNYGLEISKRVRFSADIAYSLQNKVRPTQEQINNINIPQPGFPVATADGLPYTWGGMRTVHWYSKLGGDRTEAVNYLTTAFKLDIEPIKDLHVIGTAGLNKEEYDITQVAKSINWYTYDGRLSATDPSATNNSVSRATTSRPYQSYQLFANYGKTIQNHYLGAMVGTSYEKSTDRSFSASRSGLISPDLSALNTATLNFQNSDNIQEWAIASYFSRLNYDYKGKYLLEGNFRTDGSSRFIADKRWKSFYGGSVGWVLSEENFLKRLSWFNLLKIRASLGQTGSQADIGNYDYISLLNLSTSGGPGSNNYPIFGRNQAVEQTVNVANVTSLNRSWEKITNQDVGLDFGLFDNRLTGTFDYFVKTNKDMLISPTLPSLYGADPPKLNIGSAQTKGWEVGLNWKSSVRNLHYWVRANISDYTTTITQINGNFAYSQGYNQAVEGQPLGVYYGLLYDGRIQTADQLAEYKGRIKSGLPGRISLGDNMFKDLNSDGKFDINDMVPIGADQLHLPFSFSSGGSWQGFDFSFLFQGVLKHDILRSNNPYTAPFAWQWAGTKASFYHQTWSPERPDAELPRLSVDWGGTTGYNYQASDFSIRDGRYMRLKNLVLGYSLPKSLTNRAGLSKVRVYFSGNDLWEVTKVWDGFDPEAGRDPNNDGRYPFYRSYSFGLDLTF